MPIDVLIQIITGALESELRLLLVSKGEGSACFQRLRVDSLLWKGLEILKCGSGIT